MGSTDDWYKENTDYLPWYLKPSPSDLSQYNEVSIFYAPKQNKWVVRRFTYGLRNGDCLVDAEPTDDWLAAEYPGYRVRRERVV